MILNLRIWICNIISDLEHGISVLQIQMGTPFIWHSLLLLWFQVFFVRKKLEQHVKLVHGGVLPPLLIHNKGTKVIFIVVFFLLS